MIRDLQFHAAPDNEHKTILIQIISKLLPISVALGVSLHLGVEVQVYEIQHMELFVYIIIHVFSSNHGEQVKPLNDPDFTYSKLISDTRVTPQIFRNGYNQAQSHSKESI